MRLATNKEDENETLDKEKEEATNPLGEGGSNQVKEAEMHIKSMKQETSEKEVNNVNRIHEEEEMHRDSAPCRVDARLAIKTCDQERERGRNFE